MNDDQQLYLMDIFIHEATAMAQKGVYEGDLTRCLVHVLKKTGFALTVVAPGQSLEVRADDFNFWPAAEA